MRVGLFVPPLPLRSPHLCHDRVPDGRRQTVPIRDQLAECLVLPAMFRPATTDHVVTTCGASACGTWDAGAIPATRSVPERRMGPSTFPGCQSVGGAFLSSADAANKVEKTIETAQDVAKAEGGVAAAAGAETAKVAPQTPVPTAPLPGRMYVDHIELLFGPYPKPILAVQCPAPGAANGAATARNPVS